MTTETQRFLGEIRDIRVELDRILNGMDFCLDWKSANDEWSAREILYHMAETPAGGIHSAVQQVLAGTIRELSMRSSATNMTPQRQRNDLAAIRGDAEAVLSGMELLLGAATDDELAQRTVLAHSMRANAVVAWRAEELIERLLLNHWKEHLRQLAAVRDALGIE